MATQHNPSSEKVPQAIIPVRPATGTTAAPESSIPASLLRRTLGGHFPSRRTLGLNRATSRRTVLITIETAAIERLQATAMEAPGSVCPAPG